MKIRKLILGASVAAATLATAFAASASLVFVGSWQVDEGPSWLVTPSALTGQDAAALLFGGAAGAYSISTIDSNPFNVDHLSWVSVWNAGAFGDCAGFPCGRKVAENSVTSTGGLYANPGDTSAYVKDWAVGEQFRNYAFTGSAGVPEPATWGLMIMGFGLSGVALRSRRRVATVA